MVVKSDLLLSIISQADWLIVDDSSIYLSAILTSQTPSHLSFLHLSKSILPHLVVIGQFDLTVHHLKYSIWEIGTAEW